MASSSDFFDDVLHLEDKFYADGHRQGIADGERAGRAEGRAFGIEKGFDKFVEAGRLYGRALVWANRLPRAQQDRQPVPTAAAAAAASVPPLEEESRDASPPQELRLPVLATGGARLEKNVLALHALVEPETLSTENADDAVNDFDDRVKRAQGKARVIERQTGEDAAARSAEAKSTGAAVTTTTTTAAASAAVQQQPQQPSSATAASSSVAAAPPTGEVRF